MALIPLSGDVRKEDGTGAEGIRVRAYPLNADGTVNTSAHIAEDFTDAVTGTWQLPSVDLSASPIGMVAIEVKNLSTNQVRWDMGNKQLQVGFLAGPNGDAPLSNGSVKAQHIASNTVDDTRLANLSPSDTTATAYPANGALAHKPTQLLSFLFKRIKEILGTASWKDAIPVNLTTVKNHLDSQSDVPLITVTASKAASGTTIGELVFDYSGTDAGVYRWSGSAWQPVASVGTSGELNQNAFSFIKVGTTTIAAETETDTLTLVAGSNITLTPSSAGDSVTISSTAAGGSGNAFSGVNAGGTLLSADSGSDILTISAGAGIEITGSAGTDTVTISATGGGTGGTGATDATSIMSGGQSVDSDKFPYLSGVQPGNTNAPALGNGPWKMQAGSVVVNWSGSNYFLPLQGPINGFVTSVVTDGDWGAHSTIPAMTVSVDASITGSTPGIAVRLYNAETGAAVTIGNLRLNYFVMHW